MSIDFEELVEQMESSHWDTVNKLQGELEQVEDELGHEVAYWQNMYNALDHEFSLTETGNQISRANVIIKALVFKNSYSEQVAHAKRLDSYLTDYLPELASELRKNEQR